MTTQWHPDADRIQQWQDRPRPTRDAHCPHGRSVLLDCAACPDPLQTVQESTWLLMALLLLVIGATYGFVLLIGHGL